MAEDESVTFHNFTKMARNHSNAFILLLEGEDDIEYYNPIFSRYIGENKIDWVELVCHGRKNVIELVDDLKNHTRNEYRNGIYFGFIDKDYHEVQSNPFPDKIYVTPVYSIENFYASTQFIKKILERKFYVCEGSSNDEDYKSCLKNFTDRRDEFISGITDLDCFLRCNRYMYEERKIQKKIHAREIKLYHNVSIDLNRVIFNKSALEILGLEANIFDVPSLKIAKEFYAGKDNDELSGHIRGKFMIHFIHHYLHKLKEDNLKKQPILFSKSLQNSKIVGLGKITFKRTKMTLTKENEDLMSDFSIFADVPSCLTNFLTQMSKFKLVDAKVSTGQAIM
ncbi:DUF4435 domain-containing protein [Pectobacterium polaris]|uniref:DUF4435 domain-containing protein n=1 Tax=Pectobacterium polaris TaxID=2042057 RepID=UPI001582CF60|nr:DUF4435 domain-containing protein [Pectobacterium polaris]